MNFYRNRKNWIIRANQNQVQWVSTSYGMEDSKSVLTGSGFEPQKSSGRKYQRDSWKHALFLRSVVGSLMLWFVPNWQSSVGALAKYTNSPTSAHWGFVKLEPEIMKSWLKRRYGPEECYLNLNVLDKFQVFNYVINMLSCGAIAFTRDSIPHLSNIRRRYNEKKEEEDFSYSSTLSIGWHDCGCACSVSTWT